MTNPPGTGNPRASAILVLVALSLAFLIDASGTVVAPGQSVTVRWGVDSAGFPSTTYGFSGSFLGVGILNGLNFSIEHYTNAVGQSMLDLSGMAFNHGYYNYIGLFVGAHCMTGNLQASTWLTGIAPSAPESMPGSKREVEQVHSRSDTRVGRGRGS